jgi:hypothetical protein
MSNELAAAVASSCCSSFTKQKRFSAKIQNGFTAVH